MNVGWSVRFLEYGKTAVPFQSTKKVKLQIHQILDQSPWAGLHENPVVNNQTSIVRFPDKNSYVESDIQKGLGIMYQERLSTTSC